jgi:bifunctional non-homologous end joining protein LigD
LSLETYRRKRKFEVTPEPRGNKGRGRGNAFVIQKHAARRLHYDLRLELDGVMKSWAVTRGPSLVPGEKRLAVHVEDHPLEYNDFEGTIPEGEYGGGTVMIWDRGRWIPDGDPHRGYRKGHLDFTLEGHKLHGRWHLVRMRKRPGETKEPWLLIKAGDAAARRPDQADILEAEPLSVASGRSIDDIAAGKGRRRVWHSNRSVRENVEARTPERPAVRQRTAKRLRPGNGKAPSAAQRSGRARQRSASTGLPKSAAPLPDFVPPTLASLRAKAPAGKDWVHEIKLDGYRLQARLDASRRGRPQVRLLTRKGLDWTDKFPDVAAAVASLPARQALLDGELVVYDRSGKSSFSGLQAALKSGERNGFFYEVFDLLHLDGRDLTPLALVDRKAQLARLLDGADAGPVRYCGHVEEEGPLVLRHACEMSLEGVVSKRKNAPYLSGRSDAFVKSKCSNAQELVVGGYLPSTVQPRAVGALVVGYYRDGELVYAGRVGTGYTRATAHDLWQRLHPLEVPRPPFDQIPAAAARQRKVHWVRPAMVIEANLGGWTSDGLVRQAAFKGVREDKAAEEVVREAPTEESASSRENDGNEATAPKRAKRGKAGRGAAPAAVPARRAMKTDVRLTNPDRVYWSDVGIRKQDLADYYTLVWERMAPQVLNRPLSLVRCPDGTGGECFFQKHVSAGLSGANLRMVIDAKGRQIIAIDDLDGLASLVQAGVLEVHVRGSCLDRLDLCDRMVFDIDPGQDIAWSQVVAAARDVRARLAAVGLQSFVKLTGGKGLHVVVPIIGADWEAAKVFAQALAFAMVADAPDRYIAKMTKSLRTGKIFVDYMRNSLEQTSVAAYSTRARPGAPVSAPVSWEELGRTKAGNQYTVLNLERRLAGLKKDPWRDIGRIRQALPELRALRRR